MFKYIKTINIIDMNFEKYKNMGLSGLANLGNTCFINSCMQILSHTYELNDILEDESFKGKLRNKYDSALLIEWNDLRKIMWKENCTISPGKFIKTIQRVSKLKNMEIFTGFAQNDVSEFLLFVIDCFHNSLSREIKMTISGVPESDTDKLALKCFEMIKSKYSNDYSEFWNLFYAVSISEISRVDNEQILSITPEPYLIVDLPIPPNNKSPSLIDCFNHYVEGEIIQNYKDETTGDSVDIKKRIIFWSFPNILIIDLKRFNNQLQKNQIHINFPLDDLDLTSYTISKKNVCNYELYGVCNHSGGVLGGHYTSYVKNANGKWYHFNDTSVSEVGIEQSIISPKAYVLFYRKKRMSE